MKPQRYQRSRVKGSKLPDNTICVNRPGKFGNPFEWKKLQEINPKLSNGNARAQAVHCFIQWMNGSNADWMGQESEKARQRIKDSLHELKGKNIACFCPVSAVCHGDWYLREANT